MYSCLTQFTAPELLTGNNKWACERCTDIAARKREINNGRKRASSSEDEEAEAEDAEAAEAAEGESGGKRKQKSGKKETVYSNASKQAWMKVQ